VYRDRDRSLRDIQSVVRAGPVAGQAGYAVAFLDRDAFRGFENSGPERFSQFGQNGHDLFGEFLFGHFAPAGPHIVNAPAEGLGRIEMRIVLLQKTFRIYWLADEVRDLLGHRKRSGLTDGEDAIHRQFGGKARCGPVRHRELDPSRKELARRRLRVQPEETDTGFPQVVVHLLSVQPIEGNVPVEHIDGMHSFAGQLPGCTEGPRGKDPVRDAFPGVEPDRDGARQTRGSRGCSKGFEFGQREEVLGRNAHGSPGILGMCRGAVDKDEPRLDMPGGSFAVLHEDTELTDVAVDPKNPSAGYVCHGRCGPRRLGFDFPAAPLGMGARCDNSHRNARRLKNADDSICGRT
jgi:hypothetical protein